MELKKKVTAGFVGISLLLSSVFIVNVVNENLGIQDKVQSCFKRYTTGVFYKAYSVGLTKTIGADSREAITTDQIACSLTRLGFDGSLAVLMTSKKEGRLDNDKFAAVWYVEDALECLDPREVPTTPSNDLSDVNIFRDCTKTKVTSSELRVFLKDYR